MHEHPKQYTCKSNLEFEQHKFLRTILTQVEILESEITSCEIMHDFKKLHVSKVDNNVLNAE